VFRFRGALLVVLALALPAPSVIARPPGGGLVGWVEDTRGTPVSGVVISLFGKGVDAAGLVTLSDSGGRFFLPSLPAGSYTLRALAAGHLPAPARQVTVLPDRDSTFTVSLTPMALDPKGADPAETATDATEDGAAELRWLLRHKRRSVLEEQGQTVATDGTLTADLAASAHLASWLTGVDGSVEVMANPAGVGVGSAPLGFQSPAESFSVLRLKGRMGAGGSWSLGGLVADSESTAWRTAAEFIIEPGGGHEIQAGSGYGTRLFQPLISGDSDGRRDNRSVGAIFVQDRWQATENVAYTAGARFSYIGFLDDRNHVDPFASFEVKTDDRSRVRGTVATHTIVPGGDLLTLSVMGSAPAMAFAVIDGSLRAERATHYEVAVDQALGRSTVSARAFFEDVDDQLVNAFGGPGDADTLRIVNGGAVSARGMGLTVARSFGDAFSGSVSYTYGHSWRREPAPVEEAGELSDLFAYRDADFHDFVTRVETFIDSTDTRVIAFYRVNHLSPEVEGKKANAVANNWFDVQLRQGLPFLGSLTRADWEFLLAVRNLFYEPAESATLDEIAVLNPPKRVLGGISVRF
jgi:TonB-dependent receptor-like protein/carboxypeptidase family protein